MDVVEVADQVGRRARGAHRGFVEAALGCARPAIHSQCSGGPVILEQRVGADDGRFHALAAGRRSGDRLERLPVGDQPVHLGGVGLDLEVLAQRRGRDSSSAISDRISRCFWVAASGTSRKISSAPAVRRARRSRSAGARWNRAAIGDFRPLMRPCGMATPWPRPVEPSRSRANRLSVTGRGRSRAGSRTAGRLARKRASCWWRRRRPGRGRRAGWTRDGSWCGAPAAAGDPRRPVK